LSAAKPAVFRLSVGINIKRWISLALDPPYREYTATHSGGIALEFVGIPRGQSSIALTERVICEKEEISLYICSEI
jgi:hypothetical protein